MEQIENLYYPGSELRSIQLMFGGEVDLEKGLLYIDFNSDGKIDKKTEYVEIPIKDDWIKYKLLITRIARKFESYAIPIGVTEINNEKPGGTPAYFISDKYRGRKFAEAYMKTGKAELKNEVEGVQELYTLCDEGARGILGARYRDNWGYKAAYTSISGTCMAGGVVMGIATFFITLPFEVHDIVTGFVDRNPEVSGAAAAKGTILGLRLAVAKGGKSRLPRSGGSSFLRTRTVSSGRALVLETALATPRTGRYYLPRWEKSKTTQVLYKSSKSSKKWTREKKSMQWSGKPSNDTLLDVLREKKWSIVLVAADKRIKMSRNSIYYRLIKVVEKEPESPLAKEWLRAKKQGVKRHKGKKKIEVSEKRLADVLAQYGGKRSAAARKLGIAEHSVTRRIDRATTPALKAFQKIKGKPGQPPNIKRKGANSTREILEVLDKHDGSISAVAKDKNISVTKAVIIYRLKKFVGTLDEAMTLGKQAVKKWRRLKEREIEKIRNNSAENTSLYTVVVDELNDMLARLKSSK